MGYGFAFGSALLFGGLVVWLVGFFGVFAGFVCWLHSVFGVVRSWGFLGVMGVASVGVVVFLLGFSMLFKWV